MLSKKKGAAGSSMFDDTKLNKTLNYETEPRDGVIDALPKRNSLFDSTKTQHAGLSKTPLKHEVSSFDFKSQRPARGEGSLGSMKNEVSIQDLQTQKFGDLVSLKKAVYGTLNQFSHFDSNIYNSIKENRRIVDRKNYELDSRAQSIKDYGFQPFLKRDLERKIKFEGSLFKERNDLGYKENFESKFKNYTPISQYQKEMIDCKYTDMRMAPKINYLRQQNFKR
mmetsp:Transcript_11125/g.18666  ORF Transcript_11125/g.18666 Transcript_11125/m.18666 type:complete len:224 (+) Transcript_11125:863-1534(+)